MVEPGIAHLNIQNSSITKIAIEEGCLVDVHEVQIYLAFDRENRVIYGGFLCFPSEILDDDQTILELQNQIDKSAGRHVTCQMQRTIVSKDAMENLRRLIRNKGVPMNNMAVAREAYEILFV
jgi:hypothetical protein